MRVEQTFGGAGTIAGDLTPKCRAVVTAVLGDGGAVGRPPSLPLGDGHAAEIPAARSAAR